MDLQQPPVLGSSWFERNPVGKFIDIENYQFTSSPTDLFTDYETPANKIAILESIHLVVYNSGHSSDTYWDVYIHHKKSGESEVTLPLIKGVESAAKYYETFEIIPRLILNEGDSFTLNAFALVGATTMFVNGHCVLSIYDV